MGICRSSSKLITQDLKSPVALQLVDSRNPPKLGDIKPSCGGIDDFLAFASGQEGLQRFGSIALLPWLPDSSCRYAAMEDGSGS